MILALGGGALGVLLASWGSEFVALLMRTGVSPIIIDAGPDGSVLVFASAVSIATGLACGLAPAWKTTGIDLVSALKAGSSPALPAGRRRWRQYSLVAAQIAACLVLVFAAGLLGRTLLNLRGLDAGFQPQSVVVFALDSNDTPFPRKRLVALCAEVVEGLSRRPDVRSGSCSTMRPIAGNSEGKPVTVPGYVQGPASPPFVFANSIDAGYFETLGIPIRRGRAFDGRDSAGAAPVAIISETMARHYFGEQDPVGRSFRLGRSQPLTIVGVAADVRQQLRAVAPPMAYVPLSHREEPPSTVLATIRTTGDTSGVSAAVPREVRAHSRDLAIAYVRTMSAQIGASLVGERLLVTLSAAFALLALLLASIGLYGVMSYEVVRRAREIGIRLALGARPSLVVGQIMGRVCAVTLIGVVVGGTAALAGARLLDALLFGLTTRDSATLVFAMAALAGTALVAGYLPARRASAIDPATVLRME